MRTHLASLVEDFRAHAAETAVVAHRGVRRYPTTYGQLAHLAGCFAAELDRRGIGAGERVILWGENSAEWIAVFFGCLLRGVIAVPLDAAGSTEFVARVASDVTPRLIVADASLLRGLPTQAPAIAFRELRESLPERPLYDVAPEVTEDAPFQIVFTSGTTSEPKGIVHTHRNVLASLRPIETEIGRYLKYERWFHPIRFLHTLPLSHVFGQFMGLWTPALLAAEVHFIDSWEAAQGVALIRRERVSVLIAVPRVLDLLRGHLLRQFPTLAGELAATDGLSLPNRWWRFRKVHRLLGWKFWAVISGGSSLPAELERFWNRAGYALIQGYGMTETAALVTLNHPFHIGHGTIGKVLPGREVKLSESGEILVRGETVATTTWQNGRMQARNGEWLATGDLAEEGEGGLRFVGRQGDAIVTSNGMNIFPADLETAMLAQPGVRECMVVPCEFANGMEPVSVVQFQGHDAALSEAVRNANRSLAEYQHIRRTYRWPDLSLPRTSTGKLLRRKVRERVCAALREEKSPSHASDDELRVLIAEVTGEPAGMSDDAARLSEDLHLDSLGRAQLLSLLEERMGLELQDEDLARVETLGELRALLAANAAQAVTPTQDTPAKPAALNTTEGEAAAATPDVDALHASPAPARSEHIYPHWPWNWPVRMLRIVFLEIIMRPLVRLLTKPRVRLPEAPLPPGPLLLIANHVSSYDGALVLYALPGTLRRRVAAAMSGEMLLDYRRARGQGNLLLNLLAAPAYWLVTALFNVFPLPRQQGFRRSFAHAGEAMDRGYSVLIFPEGTRSRTGEMAHFRSGIGLLAEQTNVPVVPVVLVGLGGMRVGKERWFRSGKMEVRVGIPIQLPEGTSPAEWTKVLESAVRGLLNQQHRS